MLLFLFCFCFVDPCDVTLRSICPNRNLRANENGQNEESAGQGSEEGGEEGEENSDQVSVPGISFVEQAALTSKFYEENPGGSQIWCRGNDIGHEYLPFGNAYYIDFLLAHPKGLSDNPDWTFKESDSALDMEGIHSGL